ncbi:MAG: ATP-dependent helicase [Saprospiraceae bacterium]|nr:ATP-dependent helicase [Saprospiraceae bacterium]
MIAENQSKIKTSDAFQRAYDSLNTAQKEAVEAIDGPLLVVAGPGTGKTQILALRIGNILAKTDTQPGNILCLTYTDAGAVAMRARLLKFIGPDAYRVQVHTYHSFCNKVIQEDQDVFSEYLELHHITDLEKAQMLRGFIDRLDHTNPLKRLRGNMYAEANRMDDLFSLMKRESWRPEFLLEAIEKEYNSIEKDPDNYYKITRQAYKVGDKKPNYHKKMKQMQLLAAAVEAFVPFQEMMHEAGRYDFDDMIHWVKTMFQEDEGFKSQYQERFLYVLVDEYQDTNGAQNEIIKLLCDFWERPNLFVVGDDDQAIFRFQGANISNLINLYRSYDPKVVVLTENYRSTQVILDHSGALIKNNAERITSQIPGIEKKLIAQSRIEAVHPSIRKYQNVVQEEAALFETLKHFHQRKVPLNEIAVIYRKHSHASNLVKALSQEGIPLSIKQRIDILSEPLVQNIEKILTYLHNQYERPGSEESLLFEMMHYRFFDLQPVDVAKLATYCWENRSMRKLRYAIQDENLLTDLSLKDPDSFLTFGALLTDLEKSIPHVTLQVLFERVLKKANVFREIMSGNHRTYQIQVIGTLFNHLKAECQRNPDLDLETFLDILVQMREMDIQLPMHSLVRAKDGINFITAHGAKGLEFTYVFVIGCNRRNWEKIWGGRRGYKLPSTIVDPGSESDAEDERRLFYVAMTRAKQHLHFSSFSEELNGMLREPSVFLTEMMEHTEIAIQDNHALEEQTINFYHHLINPRERNMPLIDHELIDKSLERFQMNATALDQYLTCPRSFYFERILRVPLASNQYLGFGNAVHDGLESIVRWANKGLEANAEKLVSLYQDAMRTYRPYFTKKQYENLLKHGELILPQYFAKFWPTWQQAEELIPELEIKDTEHRGVPVRGRLDLIVKQRDGFIKVIDFKTGNTDPNRRRKKLKKPEKLNELGGNYWRQMVFYKLLLRAHKDPALRMDIGEVNFVEPNDLGEFRPKEFLIDDGQLDMVSDQIVASYKKMKDHIFDVDCDQSLCTWCNFVRNDYVISEEIAATVESITDREDSTDTFFPQQMELDF